MAVFQHWTNMRLVWRIPNPEVNLLKHLCSNDCAHSNGVVLRLISRLDDDKSLHICLHCVNIPEVLEEHCCFELHTDTTVFASDGVTPFFTIRGKARISQTVPDTFEAEGSKIAVPHAAHPLPHMLHIPASLTLLPSVLVQKVEDFLQSLDKIKSNQDSCVLVEFRLLVLRRMAARGAIASRPVPRPLPPAEEEPHDSKNARAKDAQQTRKREATEASESADAQEGEKDDSFVARRLKTANQADPSGRTLTALLKGDCVVVRAPHGFWIGSILVVPKLTDKEIKVKWYQLVDAEKRLYIKHDSSDFVPASSVHPIPVELNPAQELFELSFSTPTEAEYVRKHFGRPSK
eukprot:m.225286 g.225286  ORF g.225286 m.225286 type:complete len:348 (+) comp54210_c0_seq2:25-1068(+)